MVSAVVKGDAEMKWVFERLSNLSPDEAAPVSNQLTICSSVVPIHAQPWYAAHGNASTIAPGPHLDTSAMPRKRSQSRLSIYDIPADDIDPTAPIPAPDQDLVRHALVDFDELAVLSEAVHEQLVADLVDAIRFWRGGVKAGKQGLSDKALAQQIFLSDVARALERAGIPATRWRKRYDRGDGPDADAPESFLFRSVREIAAVAGIPLPQDLKLPGKRAAQHKYGAISPAMKAAQDAELADRGHRRKPRRRPAS